MRSVLTALILLTLVTPAMASDDSPSTTAEIKARWANSARDARRRQVMQGLAVVGSSVGGALLVGQAIHLGSGPNLTPWTMAVGVGAGAWLAADVLSWRTFRGQATAAPTRGGMRASMTICW